MPLRNNKTSSNTRTGGGFSAIELIITATIVSILTGLGFIGITRARASVRLSGAAREYAAYIEKARIHSIRSHADDDSERSKIIIGEDKTSYTVVMDLDGDGDLDSKTVTLPDGVKFDTVETIAFDWRGRTWNTVGLNTESNAQVSITLVGTYDNVSIDITGSGDITVNSEVFDDEVPNVRLNIGDLASGTTSTTPTTPSTSTPTTGGETADPTPTPLLPGDDTTNPNPTPTPIGEEIPLPTPTPAATPTPTPAATPVPTPTATPSPTPTPAVCRLSVDALELVLSKDATSTIKVSTDSNTSLTITGTSSKPSDLQVSPGSQTVAAGGVASFTIKSKKTIGIYSATFSTSCGSKTVTVLVVGLL